MSPNNSISKDVPDTCFLCHDAEYATSYFSWKSDMKLVSRLVQTRDQWPEDSVKLLNSIVIYFATIGASLAIIKGSIVGEATGTDKEEAKDDLFAAVAPGALQLEPEEYFIQKKEFYESFETGLKEGFENHSPLGKNTPFQSRSRIGNIKFEIL